jgi:hypothetical protein
MQNVPLRGNATQPRRNQLHAVLECLVDVTTQSPEAPRSLGIRAGAVASVVTRAKPTGLTWETVGALAFTAARCLTIPLTRRLLRCST